jgi:hypothetical protein
MALRSLLILSLIFLQLPSDAQQVRIDTTRADSVIRKSFAPTGLRIGTDLVSLIKSQRQDNFNGWEVNADIDFHRYLLAVDVGSWGRSYRKDSTAYSSTYKNDGKYWRVGVDANFLTRDPDRNVFFLGMRYGRSKYSESMSIIASDSLWGDVNRNYSTNDLTARWFELTTGLKVKIYKFIWMGYTGSLKFGLKKNDDLEIRSHDVPGYGNTSRDTAWGFTYSVYLRIPFRKTVPILPPKKK